MSGLVATNGSTETEEISYPQEVTRALQPSVARAN